jgi:hypothetical protein
MYSESDVLYGRMLRHSMRLREPNSARDMRYNRRAIRMLVLVGCLNYALEGLVTSLRDAGLYVRLSKHNVNRALDISRRMHDAIYRDVVRGNERAIRAYNELRDDSWWSIDGNVLLEGVCRDYNISVSLCRLIVFLRDELRGHYEFSAVRDVEHIISLLSVLDVEDKNIDIIIDRSVDICE